MSQIGFLVFFLVSHPTVTFPCSFPACCDVSSVLLTLPSWYILVHMFFTLVALLRLNLGVFLGVFCFTLLYPQVLSFACLLDCGFIPFGFCLFADFWFCPLHPSIHHLLLFQDWVTVKQCIPDVPQPHFSAPPGGS